MYCEDYPCCGHTNDDPCEVMPYDAPGYYDTTRPGNEHALCDHENGECDVDYDEDDEEECSECGEPNEYGQHDRCCSRNNDDRYDPDPDDYLHEDAAMEFGLFGSET